MIDNIRTLYKNLIKEKGEKIVRLNLSGQGLSFIPERIYKLKQLKILILDDNHLEEIPQRIFNLRNIKHLSVNNNLIKHIPKGISSLNQLEILSLSNNQIRTIPNEITKLKKLRFLDLGWNNIGYIKNNLLKVIRPVKYKITLGSDLIGKVRINSSNRIKVNLIGSPCVIHTDTSTKTHDSDFDAPQEITSLGEEATNVYRKSLKKNKTIYLYEGKLVLIGNGRVGKTTIRKNLIKENYGIDDSGSTHGIEISKWEFPVRGINDSEQNFTFNIWDFGGQGKYRSIQQFFCTRNSMYIYVTEPIHVDSIQDYYDDFTYWISFVNSYAYKSPLIYVVNKMDLKNEVFLNEEDIRSIFQNSIKHFNKVSCKTYEGFDKLIKNIKNNLKSTGIFGVPFSESWYEVKKSLEEEDRPYIQLKEYKQRCKLLKLNDKETEVLLDYLTAIGTVIVFEKAKSLSKLIILDPEWVKKAAYNVLSDEKTIKNNGEFTENDFSRIWVEYDEEEHYKLYDLLKAFELCYEVQSDYEDKIIVPLLFPAEKPHYSLNSQQSISYDCQFNPFMPIGIISQLTVRKNTWIFKDLKWRMGLILHHEETFAEVNEKWQEKRISIKVSGKNPKLLLEILRNEIIDIKSRVEKAKNVQINLSESILCYCESCKQSIQPYRFDFNLLKKYGPNRILLCGISHAEMSTMTLLTGKSHDQNQTKHSKPNNTIIKINYIEKMKIRKQKANQIINADKISDSNIVYSHLKVKFPDIIAKYANSDDERRKLLKEFEILFDQNSSAQEKVNASDKLKGFLIKNIEVIGQSVVGGLLVELSKIAFL